MKKRFPAMFLVLALCLGLAVPAFAQDHPAPPSRDFSQYLTGEPLKKEELTLGGLPFYQLSLDEAIPHLPTPDDSQKESGVPEGGREMTLYWASWPERVTDNERWLYSIYAKEYNDTKTLHSLEYLGRNDLNGNVHRFVTEVRGIATGDEMTDVLEKLGLSAEGAAAVAEEMTVNKTNFNLNSGQTFGSSYDYVPSDDFDDRMGDMPAVHYQVDGAEVQLNFWEGKLVDFHMALILKDDAPSAPAFTDTPSWCAKEAQWAVEQGITNGAGSADRFAPTQDCPHEQILTFLWRAAGKPAAAQAPVTVASYYQDGVNWAYEKGFLDNSFQPSAPCTRAQAVWYIWKALGEPPASKTASFSDVDAGSAYLPAVSWAVEKGVTNGYGGDDTFAPGRVCGRGEIACFLYRAYN